MMATERKEHVFKDLAAEDPDQRPMEIESFCVGCGENGMTRLLLTKIPHYKEIILMSFSCEHCGLQNNEIQSGGKIQEQGIKFRVRIETERDLSRQVVKSDFASVSVPEIELEIPHTSQKGEVTTVEGILRRTVTGLEQDQPVRRIMAPDDAEKIDAYVKRIEDLLSLCQPFHIVLTDPSGNSFVENIYAPKPDPAREISYFVRTTEQDHSLGLYQEEELQESSLAAVKEEDDENGPEGVEAQPGQGALDGDANDLKNEVLSFPTNCPDCNAPASTNMKVTSIPHFKEVVIMATVCDYCSHKTNEVKSGGGIEPKGLKITLRVTELADLSRDVLKSETCSLIIPELDMEMGSHALGGKFTTLEGLLKNVQDQIEQNPFYCGALASGDSAIDEDKQRFSTFKERLNQMIEGEDLPFTVILDDPCGNSYLQNVYAPEADPEMTVEHYERSWQQNEDLGLNDMKVEGYEEAEDAEACR